jgi:protease II
MNGILDFIACGKYLIERRYTSAGKLAGHGIDSTRDQVYAERADVWSFFLAVFGDPEFVAK